MELPAGTEIIKEKIRAAVTVPAGHKIATHDIAEGSPVRRYNQIIGFAVKPIKPGDHVPRSPRRNSAGAAERH